VKRLAAWKKSQEQPVWLQGQAALHQLPKRVIGPVQTHGVNDQIMRPPIKADHLIVGDNSCRGHRITPQIRKSRHDGG
jgi:hypothetical protein